MIREKVILSNLDLNILFFIKKERFVKDIIEKFDIDYLSEKRHLNRLKILNCYQEVKFGTFKKIKSTKKGDELLGILKWKM
jgi:hypothetical protein